MMPTILREVSPEEGMLYERPEAGLARLGPGGVRRGYPGVLGAREGRPRGAPLRMQPAMEEAARRGDLAAMAEAAGVARPSVAGERFRERVREAWEEVGAPREGWRLPEAVRAAGELARRPVPAGEVVPEVPGAEMWQPALTEEQAEAVGRRLGAWGRVPGAVWADIKQLPVVGRGARAAEAAVRTGLEVFPAVTGAVEEIAARGLQRLPGGRALPPLQPERQLTEEQRAEAERIAEDTGMPEYLAQQGVLLQARVGEPSVRQYAVETYGRGAQTGRALSELGLGLGYSSYEAQRKALDRLMAGENLETVTSGRQVNTYEPTAEDMAAFNSYIEGIRRREGDDAARAAAVEVQQSGFIPGESDLANEILFQTGLDPLNLLDIGVWRRGFEARRARAAGRVLGAAEVAEEAAGVARIADDVAAGTGRALGAVADARGAAAGEAGTLRRLWDRYNPFAPTARAQAEQLANAAYQAVTPAVMQVESADEAVAVVRAMAEEPERLVGAMGRVPAGELAERGRPLLREVLEDVEGFPSMKGPFNRQAFLADLDEAVTTRALALTGAEEELTGYRKFAQGYKNLMSEFYLRTWGYATRNAGGDLVTMAWDGVASFDSRTDMAAYLERFGPTTRRVSEAVAAGQQTEVGVSRLPGVLGEVSEALGRTISRQEEGRYLRAYTTSLQKTWGRVWRPRVPDELRGLLGDEAARLVEDGLGRSVNLDEMGRVVDQAMGEGGRLVDVGRYVEDPDVLSVGMRMELEQRLGGVADEAGVEAVVDELAGQVRERAAGSWAADPTPPGRRVWSDFEAVQDLREEQGWIEGLGQRMGVGGDETARATAEFEEALRPGEIAIRDAAGDFGAGVAGAFDQGSANLVRAVRADTGRWMREARAAADRLRTAAWEAVRQGEDGRRVWSNYFRQVGDLYLQNQQRVLGRFQEGMEQLRRLEAGEDFETVVGRPVERIVEENLAQLRALAEEVETRRARQARLGIEGFEDFDRMLDSRRLAVDTAEAEAWRLAAMNPSRDALDVVMSTQEGVDRMARAAAEEMRQARARMLGQVPGPRMSAKEYRELGETIWGGYFRNASQGWDLARWELAQLPLNGGAQQRALQALGWPAEEAARLAGDQVQAVLGAGVRWDPMLGAPSMPLEEAMRGTLAEVAGAARLDLAQSADWTPSQWEGVAMQARAMANEAGTRASAVARRTRAAVEIGVEAAAGAPQTVAAGMELAWPASVDDVARAMGIRPQRAGADEWAQVAAYAEQRGTAARMMGEEFGRRSLAAQEAERLPEWGQAFGESAMVRRGRMSFAEEMGRLEELGGEARQAAEQTVGWVLGEAGFGADELEGLTWQQRQRLVEEIGQGELLRTPGGRVSQIDAIEEERRRRILERVRGTGITEAAFGIGMDPEAAVGYRWLEVAEEARARGAALDPSAPGLGRGVVSPPGMYDAAGFPVSREAVPPRRVGQRAVVERAEALVPAEARLGRGEVMVGFEERQAWLAERYQDLADMAQARAGLMRDGRRVGEVLDVPEGVVRASTRKEAGMYMLDLADDRKRVLRSYWFENYPEARTARDQAREIIKSGQQGQQGGAGTAWSGWRTADVGRADTRAAAAGGYAGAPTLADAAAVQSEMELAALEQIREFYKADLAVGAELGAPGAGLPPMARRRLREWLEGPLARQWSETRAVAVDMARDAADYALLDYVGGRKRFDDWLGMAFPYTYWKTRSGRNWLLRFGERPGALAAYQRMTAAQRRRTEEKGYRERFEGMVEIPVPGMAEWTGRAVFVDPASLVMPWTQILGPEWAGDPSEAENMIDLAYRVSQRLGARPYGFIEWPLQYAGWIGKREEIGYVLPHTGAIQAATAAAGIGGPGGVSIEEAVRRGLGLPEQEPYQAYRVMRMVANMAAEDPSLEGAGLIAQELQRRVEAGELTLDQAMGLEATDLVRMLAEDQGWSGDELAEGQGVLQEAVRRSALERGMATGAGFAVGVPMRMYPAGERRQVELEAEQRGRMYSPLTGMGTRAALEEFREEHPEAMLRRLARAGLPGAGEYEGWTPGQAWQSAAYRRRAEEIERTYDAAIDDLLRREPWNQQARRELEEQRRGELDVLRDEVMGAMEEEEAYRARSVYGASPEEAAEIRREEVLAAVSAAMPKMAEFTDEEGTVDYEAYETAVGDFFAELDERMAGDERLLAVGDAMQEEMGRVAGAVPGRGARVPGVAMGAERVLDVEQLVAGVTREAIEEYWRRNDTPMEALQRVWEEEIYSEAWETYNRAVDRGMEKGEAYERYIERAGEGEAAELIEQVMAAYPERWSRRELEEAYQGVSFPAVGEVSILRKPEEEQALARGQEAFWDFFNEGLPPGKLGSGAREHHLIQMVLDAETRGTVTAEQYAQALERMEEWAAENRTGEWLTPEDWAQARELNEEFQDLVERWLPGVDELLDEYYELGTAERREFRKEHPEIGEYYDARDWYGEQPGNEVWAYFYLGKGMEGQAAPAALRGAGQYYRRYYPRRYYPRRRYGGRRRRGGGAAEPDWKFAYQARDVPRVYLETPAPWEGALRLERPYRAQGTPWVFGRWRNWRSGL